MFQGVAPSNQGVAVKHQPRRATLNKVVLMVLDAPKKRRVLATSAQMVPKLGRQYV